MKTFAARRPLLALCLLAGLLAAGAAAWSWHQVTRPGRVHFERGLDYASAKQIPQAEQEWLAGIREDPNFPDNHAQLGDLYTALGRPGEAAVQYQAASRLTPKDGALFLRLARADEAAGDMEAARAAAEHAAALHPGDFEAQSYFGILAAKLNHPAAAQAPLAHAHALAPDDASVLIYLVRVEFQRRDLAGVERDLTPFILRHPDNAETSYLMASLLHQKPQTTATSQAEVSYAQHAQEGAPGNADANLLLGQAFLDAHQPAQALPAFQRARTLMPHSQAAIQGLLSCYTRLQQPALAEHASADLDAETTRRDQMARLTDRLNTAPADIAATLELARLREENGETALAESYYRRAVRHAPQDPKARAALAGFLRHTGHHRP